MQSASTCTVLLVEDDPEQLALWSTALRTCSSHYAVLEAAGCQEGLDLFRQQKVDCVLLDLDLTDSSGFQSLLDLIPDRRRPEIAILILSRLWNPTLAEMALHNGAQAYLIKQHTSVDALDEAIKNAITSVATALGESPKLCS